jgi:hypothetical protein
MQGNEPYCSVFLFINSGSGGGVGQKLIAQEVILSVISGGKDLIRHENQINNWS